jgi:hypothetical protein
MCRRFDMWIGMTRKQPGVINSEIKCSVGKSTIRKRIWSMNMYELWSAVMQPNRLPTSLTSFNGKYAIPISLLLSII